MAAPAPGALDALCAGRRPPLRTGSGQPLRFVAPAGDGEAYEARIWRCGEVATRPGDAHDFFNGLAWLNFPHTKALINARHVAGLAREQAAGNKATRRDAERDRLTHFDECGAIVVARDPTLLSLLAGFRWRALFVHRRADVVRDMALVIFGHASLEALAAPFRGLTVKAVLEPVDDAWFGLGVAARIADLDTRLCQRIAAPGGLATPPLQPVPLLGWPGVVAASEDAAYYDDTFQFRPGRRAAPAV